MDELDQDILMELQKDAKVKLKTIAKKLCVPLSTIYMRIKKMEEIGIIKSYTVDVDWEKLGYTLKAYVLVFVDTTKLKELRKPQKEILDRIKNLPFVHDAEVVTGDADMVMVVRARDTEHLGQLLTGDIQDIAGIVKTKSLVTIS